MKKASRFRGAWQLRRGFMIHGFHSQNDSFFSQSDNPATNGFLYIVVTDLSTIKRRYENTSILIII